MLKTNLLTPTDLDIQTSINGALPKPVWTVYKPKGESIQDKPLSELLCSQTGQMVVKYIQLAAVERFKIIAKSAFGQEAFTVLMHIIKGPEVSATTPTWTQFFLLQALYRHGLEVRRIKEPTLRAIFLLAYETAKEQTQGENRPHDRQQADGKGAAHG